MKIYDYIQLLHESTFKNDRFKNKICYLAGLLNDYNPQLTVCDFTEDTTGRFYNWLIYTRNFKLGSVAYVSGTLKQVLKSAAKTYPIDFGYREVRVQNEESPFIFLNLDEIKRIIDVSGLTKSQQNVRDFFILMCFTGLRFGDICKLSPNNVSDGNIIVKTSKTGKIVELPLCPPVQEILDRWGDNFPKCPAHQSFRLSLHQVSIKSGFTESVVIRYTLKGEIVEERVPKYKLITPHTGRRSFATNLYLSDANIPLWRILLLTGHTSPVTFFKYVRITRQENTLKLRTIPFFRDTFGEGYKKNNIVEANTEIGITVDDKSGESIPNSNPVKLLLERFKKRVAIF